VLLVFVGLQLLAIGLVAELVVRTYHEAQRKPTYAVREALGVDPRKLARVFR
jgi:hypothetical protein